MPGGFQSPKTVPRLLCKAPKIKQLCKIFNLNWDYRPYPKAPASPVVCPLTAHLFSTRNCEDTKGTEQEDSAPRLGNIQSVMQNTIKIYDSAWRTHKIEPQIVAIVGGMISHNLRTAGSAFMGLLYKPANQKAHIPDKLGFKSNLDSSSKANWLWLSSLLIPVRHSLTHSLVKGISSLKCIYISLY